MPTLREMLEILVRQNEVVRQIALKNTLQVTMVISYIREDPQNESRRLLNEINLRYEISKLEAEFTENQQKLLALCQDLENL